MTTWWRARAGALVAEYQLLAASTLAEVAAAERLCCAGIDWRVDGATLTVRATAERLDALETMLRA